MKNWCIFCQEQLDPSIAEQFMVLDQKHKSRIIYQNKRVFVVPGLGPQVYPYVLVVTKEHISSLAESNSQDRADILDALHVLLELKIYPSETICIFENGGCGVEGSSCIDHCHIHVVDGKFDINRVFSSIKKDAKQAELSRANPPFNSSPYLFSGSFSGGEKVNGWVSKDTSGGRQYFRRILAALLKSDEWDWRLNMNSQWMTLLINEVKNKSVKSNC